MRCRQRLRNCPRVPRRLAEEGVNGAGGGGSEGQSWDDGRWVEALRASVASPVDRKTKEWGGGSVSCYLSPLIGRGGGEWLGWRLVRVVGLFCARVGAPRDGISRNEGSREKWAPCTRDHGE